MTHTRAFDTTVLVTLMVVMVATRFHHFGDALHLPDASLALFFLGGLYLRRLGLYALLLGLAVAIDYVAIRQRGLDFFAHYCVTPAYFVLLVSYAVPWMAGRLCASRLRARAGALALTWLAGGLAVAASFLLSNAAFYWFGGRYADPNWPQYVARLWQWGPLFVRTSAAYLAVAMVLHYIVARWVAPPRNALPQA